MSPGLTAMTVMVVSAIKGIKKLHRSTKVRYSKLSFGLLEGIVSLWNHPQKSSSLPNHYLAWIWSKLPNIFVIVYHIVIILLIVEISQLHLRALLRAALKSQFQILHLTDHEFQWLKWNNSQRVSQHAEGVWWDTAVCRGTFHVPAWP